MNSFKGFVVKEFKQIYRDKRTLLVLFGMPIIMMILFGFAIRNEVEDASVAVLDFAKDEVTTQIIRKIEASNYFTVHTYLQRYEDIEQQFQEGETDEVVIFEQNFAQKLKRGERPSVQIVADASNPNLSKLIQEYTTAIIKDYEGGQAQINPLSAGGAVPHTVMMFNPNMESVNLFVPGLIAVILMLICALMTSISITREKEMGNMEVLLVSPLKPYHIIIGKVLPYLVLAFADVLVILVLAQTVFGVPVRGSYLLLLAESLLFIFVALALGIFISTQANNQQTAMMVSLAGLLLPTVILSGFVFPISSMPVPLQILSNVIPARWFLEIVRSIMLKEANIFFLWKETVVLVGMMLLFIGISVRSFDIRLE